MQNPTRSPLAPLMSLLALAAAAALVPHAAEAAPVRLSYTGSISFGTGDALALADFPVGTALSWSFTLDDSFTSLAPCGIDIFTPASQPTRGTLTLGTTTYDLTRVRLNLFAIADLTLCTVDRFDFDIVGTGPTTASGGTLASLGFSMQPDLGLRGTRVGFDYGPPGLRTGYVNPTGTYRVERLAVPLPGTLPLLALALVGLVGMTATGARRGGVKAPARP
jgi:hypothetical protein